MIKILNVGEEELTLEGLPKFNVRWDDNGVTFDIEVLQEAYFSSSYLYKQISWGVVSAGEGFSCYPPSIIMDPLGAILDILNSIPDDLKYDYRDLFIKSLMLSECKEKIGNLNSSRHLY